MQTARSTSGYALVRHGSGILLQAGIPCSCRTLAPPPSSPFVSLLYTKQKNGAYCSVFCLGLIDEKTTHHFDRLEPFFVSYCYNSTLEEFLQAFCIKKVRVNHSDFSSIDSSIDIPPFSTTIIIPCLIIEKESLSQIMTRNFPLFLPQLVCRLLVR